MSALKDEDSDKYCMSLFIMYNIYYSLLISPVEKCI